MTIEAMKLALDALETLMIERGSIYEKAITALKERLAQPEQAPVAFPRQAGDSTWIIDTAFIWRVKHTIEPNTPYDWTPSEEQIETVLLSLEKIPSSLYTTPPQRTEQEPVIDKSAAIRIATALGWTPPRTWVGLTDEEIADCAEKMEASDPTDSFWREFFRGIEAKLKEKNT